MSSATRRAMFATTALLSLAACKPEADAPQAAPSTTANAELTRRQKDSILANSKVPMAGAVKKAMGAADAASAQAAAEDAQAR
jgi:hypothetical protein